MAKNYATTCRRDGNDLVLDSVFSCPRDKIVFVKDVDRDEVIIQIDQAFYVESDQRYSDRIYMKPETAELPQASNVDQLFEKLVNLK